MGVCMDVRTCVWGFLRTVYMTFIYMKDKFIIGIDFFFLNMLFFSLLCYQHFCHFYFIPFLLTVLTSQLSLDAISDRIYINFLYTTDATSFCKQRWTRAVGSRANISECVSFVPCANLPCARGNCTIHKLIILRLFPHLHLSSYINHYHSLFVYPLPLFCTCR